MKLYLTKGMFGEKLNEIGSETDSVKTVFEHVFAWKNDLNNQKRYKIERYDRMTLGDGNLAIDFGDYNTFMLIEDITDEQRRQFFEV